MLGTHIQYDKTVLLHEATYFCPFTVYTNDLIFTQTNDAVRLSAWLGWKQTDMLGGGKNGYLTRFRRTSDGDVIPGPEQGFDIVGGYDVKLFFPIH